MRTNLDSGIISALIGNMKLRGAVVTLAGNLVLGGDCEPLQMIDPTAARDVTLPPEADSENKFLIISNRSNGAENITVKNDAAATINVLTGSATASLSETGLYWCDGTTWYSILTAVYQEN